LSTGFFQIFVEWLNFSCYNYGKGGEKQMKDRIHAVRASVDLTMAAFAKRIGMTTSSISLFESSKATPSDRTILSICREFGVNEHWLRTGEGEMFEQTRETVLDRLAAEYSLDKEQVSVIENFLDLSPQERTLFLTQMRKVFGGPAAQPPRRVDVSDDVAAAVANVQDEVARYNAEQADEAASGGKESSSIG
jgi:transcriptional regulator with XRE-family HTH domain